MRTKLFIVATLALAALAYGQKRSKGEIEAFNAMVTAQNPDDKIKAAENLIAKYKDSEFKTNALELEAEAYEQKGDSVNAIIYAQRAVEADAKNFSAMLIVARQLAQTTRENDLDKDEKLKRATKSANDALSAIESNPKASPPMPEEQWAQLKKEETAQAHETLGVIAGLDKKFDVSVKEYQTALESNPNNPVTMVRLASALNNAGKFDDASAMADKVIASNTTDGVKKFAQGEKQRAEKGKAGKK